MVQAMAQVCFASSCITPRIVSVQGSFCQKLISISRPFPHPGIIAPVREKSKASLSSPLTDFPRLNKKKRLQYRAASDASHISTVKPGQQFVGRVCDVGPANSAWIDINVKTSSGRSVRARLRLSVKDGRCVFSEMPGAIIPVCVRKVNTMAGRIEVFKAHPSSPSTRFDPSIHKLLESVVVSEQLEGRVLAVGTFGAVLDVGVFRTAHRNKCRMLPALLSRKRFPATWATSADVVRRSDTTRTLKPGDQLTVWVRAAYPQSARLFVDAKPVDPKTMLQEKAEMARNRRKARRRRRKSHDSVEIGEQLQGLVRELAPFGVFIDAGLNRDVLLHYSKMGDLASNWQDVLHVGTQLVVEVCGQGERGLEAKFLYVFQLELQRAREKATGPSANAEDIKKLQFLESQVNTFPNRPVEQSTVSSSQIEVEAAPNNNANRLRAAQGKSTSLGDSRHAKVEDESVEDEELDEEMQEDSDADADDIFFSDEYLEEKYSL